jgi:hypothetical protein
VSHLSKRGVYVLTQHANQEYLDRSEEEHTDHDWRIPGRKPIPEAEFQDKE